MLCMALAVAALLPASASALPAELLHPAPVASDNCGQSVAGGDFNADGRDDVAMGCYGDDAGGASSAGSAVVRLRNSGNTGFDTGVVLERGSPAASDFCGRKNALAAGDFNGDGRDDLLVGCYGADPNAASSSGMAIVFLRNSTNDGFLAGEELTDATPVASDYCGYAVAAGDVNGDGRDDAVLGCYGADPSGATTAGKAIVFVRNSTNNGWEAAVGIVAATPVASDSCGRYVAAGDVNGDGRADVALGCTGGDPGGVTSGGYVQIATRNTGNSGFDAAVQVARASPVASDFCGSAVELGDVNGDARADLAVGCYGLDPSAVSSGGGVIVLVRNVGNTGFTEESTLARSSPVASDNCGETLGVGDSNGDGRVDVLAGCDTADPGSATSAGLGVLFQRNSANSGFDVAIDFVDSSHAANDFCGSGVTFADVDGNVDGRDELISGCYGDDTGASSAGNVIVANPDTTPPLTPPLVAPGSGATIPFNPSFTATYTDSAPASGGTIEVEVCSDSACSTVVASGSGNAVDSGREGQYGPVQLADGTYYWRARARDLAGNASAWTATQSLTVTHGEQSVERAVPAASDYCGDAVAAGDVNADGRADVISGCWGADPSGASSAGLATVAIRNSANTGFLTPVELQRATPVASDYCGTNGGVAAGDINGDGRDDVVLGCYGADPSGTLTAGVAVVFLRNSTNDGFEAPVELARASPAASDACGERVATGDLNGDGRDDVLMGCDGADPGGISSAGVAVAFVRNAGNTGFDTPVELTSAAPMASDMCSKSLATADVNADARADVLLGCYGADPGGVSGAGIVSVITRNSGNTGFDVPVDLPGPGTETFQYCGDSVAGGDVNGDGRDDVVAGCYGADPKGISSAGKALVFTRDSGNSGFDAPVELTDINLKASDSCGWEGIGVGDLDGSGTDDVAVGCYTADPAAVTSAGQVNVFTRNATNTGFDPVVPLVMPSITASTTCGEGVAVGDVDGDARNEVVSGCEYGGTGGQAWVFPYPSSAPAGPQPYSPTALAQYRDDGTTPISAGSWTTDGVATNIVLKFSVRDPDSSQTLTPWVEYRPYGTGFSGTCGTAAAGAVVSGTGVSAPTAGTPVTAVVTITGLASGSRYVWRACAVDQSGNIGAWTSNGGAPDFGVDNVAPSAAPALVSPADAAAVTATPELTATYADATPGSPGRLDMQLCSDSSCTSVLQSGSSGSGLGQDGNGSWKPSSLSSGTYHWRARSVDSVGAAGPWSATRSFTSTNTLPPRQVSDVQVVPGSGTLKLTWTNPPDTDLAGIRIYRSTSQGTLGTLVKTVLVGDTPNDTWTDSGLTNGSTYYYHLVAYNSYGAANETTGVSTSTMTPMRYGAGVATDGRKAWVMGGCSNCTYYDDIWEYDPDGATFTKQAATLATPRLHPRAVHLPPPYDKVYVFGGFQSGTLYGSIHRYDPATDTMTYVGAMPSGRSWGAAVYSPVTGKIYYLGGAASSFTPTTHYATIYEFDPATGTMRDTTHTLPQPMSKMFAAYWPKDDCIYMFGGVTTSDAHSDRIVRYCPVTGTTTNVGTLPWTGFEIPVVTTPNEILLAGGHISGSYSSTVYGYAPEAGTLLQHAVALGTAAAHQAAPDQIGGTAYLFAPFPLTDKATWLSAGALVKGVPESPPTISLTAPVGGEVWAGSQTKTISWSSTASSPRTVSLYWSPDNGANWSLIASGLALTSSYSWRTPLSQSTQMLVRAVIVNGDGTSTGLAATSGAFTVDGMPPGALTNVAATPGNGQVALSWTSPADADFAGVKIYRATTAGALGTLVQTVLAPGTSWTDTGLTNGTEYVYHLVAYDSLGNERETAVEGVGQQLPTRHGAGTATDGTNAYSFGGTVGSNASAQIFRYDPVKDLFTVEPASMPFASRRQKAVWVGGGIGRFFILGGHLNDGSVTDKVVSYDPVGKTSALAGTLPQPRKHAGIAYSPATGYVYVLGGDNGSAASASIYRYDPATGTSIDTGATLPSARNQIVAEYWPGDQCIYVFGGSISGGKTDEIVRYCPSTNTATALSTKLPEARSEGVPVAFADGMVVVAGSNTAGYHDRIGWLVPGSPATYRDRGGVAPATKVWTQGVNIGGAAYLFAPYMDSQHALRVIPGSLVSATPALEANTPGPPTSLVQLRNDGATVIASGAWTTDGAANNITFTFSMQDPGSSQTLTPWVEVRPYGTAFSGTCGTAEAGVVVSGPAVAAATANTDVTGTVTITGLTSGTQYVWRACVVDQGGYTSSWTARGGTPDFGVDSAAPPAPAHVSPADTANTGSAPTLTATYADTSPGSPGRLDFELCSTSSCTSTLQSGSSSAGLASGTNGSWTITAVGNGTYYWRARSVDGAGTAGAWSTATSFSVVTPPNVPTLVSPADTAWVRTAYPALSATFSDPDAGETGTIEFELCSANVADPWSTNCTGSYAAGESPDGIPNGNDGEWQSTLELPDGTASWYWRARAIDMTAATSSWSASRSFRVDSTPPTTPSNLRVTKNGLGAITVEWDPSTDATSGIAHYEAQISYDGITWTTECANVTSPLTCFKGGLGGRTKVFFRVRAYDNAGNVSAWRYLNDSTRTAYYLRTDDPSSLLTSAPNQEAKLPPAGTQSTSTTITQGNTSGWYLAQPGVGSTTSLAGEPADAPYSATGSGWVVDDYAGKTADGGPLQVTLSLTSSDSNGVATIQCRLFRVVTSAGGITSHQFLSKQELTQDVATGGASEQVCDLTAMTSTYSFPTNEALYLEVWLHNENPGSNGPGSNSITIVANDTSSFIAVPLAGDRPDVPTLVSPADAALVTTTPTLTATYSHPAAVDGIVEYEIATDSGFTTVVQSGSSPVVTSGSNASFTAQALTAGVTYHWRARAKDNDGRASSWTTHRTFATNTPPTAPMNLDPAAGATSSTLTPTLWASAFLDGDAGDSHGASEWQIRASDKGYNSSAAESGPTTTSLTSWTVPVTLTSGTQYFWRVRYQDANGAWSDWSNETSFTAAISSVTLAFDAATVDFGLLTPAVDAVATSVITVTATDSTGYTLTATDESDTWGIDCACGGQVADWAGTDSTPSQWPTGTAGYFGITVRDTTGSLDDRLAKWGPANASGWPDTDFTNNHFAGLESTTSTRLHATTTSTTGDTITMTYRANPTATTMAGSYGATIVYTATANP